MKLSDQATCHNQVLNRATAKCQITRSWQNSLHIQTALRLSYEDTCVGSLRSTDLDTKYAACPCAMELLSHFLILSIAVTVPCLRPYFLMTFRSCSMSNSSVASFPAKSMIAFLPPGWSPKKLVTSKTSSPMITQQSLSVRCLATSSMLTDI